MKKLLLLCALALCTDLLHSQPVPLRPDITVSHIADVPDDVARVAQDPITGKLYFIRSTGKVYSVDLSTQLVTQEYTSTDHGISYLQGMVFSGNTLFLIGNTNIDTTSSIGYVKKGVLQPNNTRLWSTVLQTDPYPISFTWYDHGFSGIALNPAGDSLIINSGSRTNHGEQQTNGNLYPGLREAPLTACMFIIPANAQNLTLPNNEVALSPFIYAKGLRNSFDMAFMDNGDLIATENSGSRDDVDELNWIRRGRHYGFPWMHGDWPNPQQFGNYDPNNDVCINHACNAWQQGYFHNDPTFPPHNNMTFTAPIRNWGPDADKFRDTITGQVKDASDLGTSLGTFTPHRSPLGLIFDNDSLIGGGLTGDGFLVSFTTGGDSTGMTPNNSTGTVADASEDLLHLKLTKDIANDNYNAQITTIVKGFKNPVDACQVGNNIYVIEHAYGGGGAKLWRVSMPPVGIAEEDKNIGSVSCYPNPAQEELKIDFTLRTSANVTVQVRNALGSEVMQLSLKGQQGKQSVNIETCALAPGVYTYSLNAGGSAAQGKFVVMK